MLRGHPKGLFMLAFTEMWERLAFYTMVGVLLLYATDSQRGGLGLSSGQGNEIYGLYLAFVYLTPFIGGMIADRFLGYRRAVVVGGLIMGGGLFLMGVPGFTFFLLGIVGLVIGNGFFKPNISVMVGNLYEPGDPKRDSGFNIFYMGINTGALIAPLILAPYMRNNFGWLWTFRAAGIGVLIAVVLMFINWRRLERADRQPEQQEGDTSFGEIMAKIIGPALVVGIIAYFVANSFEEHLIFQLVRPAQFGFLAGMIPVIIFFVRLGLTANEEEKPGLLALLPIYMVGGAFFMILHLNGSAMTQWARDTTTRQVAGPGKALTWVLPSMQQDALPNYYDNAAETVPRPDPQGLMVVDEALVEGSGFEPTGVARMYGQQRMDRAVVEILKTRAPGDVSVEWLDEGEVPDGWRERAVDVYPEGKVKVNEEVGAHGESTVTVSVPPTVGQVGEVVFLRKINGEQIPLFLIDQHIYESIYDAYLERYGHEPELLPPGKFLSVVNPEVYQSWNPFFVLLLTPFVVAFFHWRISKGKPIPTAHKLLYGMLLTSLALIVMAIGGFMSDGGALKVSSMWLMGFYLIVTAGELFLSPMGLSLVTKITPHRLVGLAMGGWFMATAFGNNLSGFFGGIQHRLEPAVFFLVLAGVSAFIALLLFLVLGKLDEAIKRYGA